MALRWTLAIACALATLGAAPAANAHDYWIRPARFQVPSPRLIPVRLFVGTRGDVAEHPYRPSATVRFSAHGPRGSRQVRGAASRRPAGRVMLRAPGVHTLVFQSRHSYIELAAEKFAAYLAEEGLGQVLAARQRSGQVERPGRESYFRNCKALVRVGESARGHDRRVGLPLEITAIDNPFVEPGTVIELAVERRGRPAAGIKVDLIALDGMDAATVATSDRKGRIRVRIPHAGAWMLAATDMRPAPSGVRGDWESAWASLSFEVPGANPRRPR